ncbi:hypothetical protein AALP_AA8G138400 [Arabis alpina]|uniref:Uncharacterized protein n=1 Tax=Arabis alpina TaxID=50452 RepID=A0A087G6W9_ARAAL|nr:hypothetical protein AALP_AA8G138400 [Arabis alpina]
MANPAKPPYPSLFLLIPRAQNRDIHSQRWSIRGPPSSRWYNLGALPWRKLQHPNRDMAS